jgi:uncharacterized cupin superfamily protein
MSSESSESPLRRDAAGLLPETGGWFIVNVADAQAISTGRFGDGTRFEGDNAFPGLGINIRLLAPGQPASMYHREDSSEAFVVLSGECTAIVEDTERPMRKGDFLFLPPGTAHVLVGAGDGPAAVLMAGNREEGERDLSFPVSAAAAKYGASVEEETADAAVAYAGTNFNDPTTIGLPW